MKRIKRAVGVLLAVLLSGSMLTLPAAAQEEMLHKELPGIQNEASDPQALHAAYVDQQMRDFGILPYYSDYGDSRIQDANTLAFYRDLKAAVRQIADHGGASAIEVDLSERPLPMNTDFQLLIEYLLADCPYELYWYDKTTSLSMSYGCSNDQIVHMTLNFPVVGAYQAENYDINAPAVKVPAVSGGTVAAARENALAVVLEHDGKTDLEKLTAYKDYICDNVDYNWDAVNNNEGFGDPWQLVWVFDGAPSTKVVCEGYSKAFQYLCELSDFEDPYFACYLVTGHTVQIGGTGGGHMWNHVTLKDVNYLVDVTNTDSLRQAGLAEEALFMNPSGDAQKIEGSDYAVTFGGGMPTTLAYIFYDSTRELYPPEILTLGPRTHTYTGGLCEVCGRPESTQPERKPGDINGDDAVNTGDVLLLMQHLARMEGLVLREEAMDTNGDGLVNIRDALLLMQYLAKFDVTIQ